ncbi:protein SUPPRESSOR OF npr1-1, CONSTITUTIVE 1 isoform X2 [Prunus persica]|uniref:protein SUPPRESSOR OF npr1-1, CONSTITUTIVE 1 isoform X2 n=1 Tax=Prunus persica TaxID=3760 RepID=UPI0009AB5FE3|nr:protein SUPPRESSOR OF npr1-1, CONSTITUTIVE 1 isoform X2 [Prunus persica]
MALVRAAQQTPSSKAFRCCRYHVFLSFRGQDTRKTFTDHLYTALVNAGFRTFRDDDEVERGEGIKPELQKAIKHSRTSVIVFSKNYASSRWCLDELVMILEHKRISADHVILPVFYDVDPSDVRKQTGSLAKAFARHQKTQPSNKEKEWREALAEVADLAGMVLQNQGYESKFINKIVQVIGEKLRRRPLNVPHIMIGMHSRVHELNLWLQDGSDDVGILVIYGMSGIGKTTIAKSVYNTNFERFGGSSFIENIREISQQPNGLVQIQKQLLYDILIGRKVKIQSVSEGMTEIQDAISSKRVFLVLDDVDHISQLDVVLGMKDQFYPGSKIIITTRRAGLLKAHQVTKVHAVQTLDNKESLELFSWHAFGRDHPIEDYIEYSKKLVDHCGGLPLALQVLGSSLLGESIGVWKSALEKLKAIPNGEIVNKLRVHMHDLICGMGREVVHQESEEPWKRSRIWHHKDSFKILLENNGTRTIEGLVFDMHMLPTNILIYSNEIVLETNAFAKMWELKLLHLGHVQFNGSYAEFCTGLRWLCWTKFPLDSIPTEFSLRSLVVLEMRYSSLRQVCKGTKCLPSLKILDLSHSHSLTETTDFSFCPNLEKLILVNCVSLIYGSIGNLERLVYLNMKDCKNLKMLPEDICMLKLLETLIISGCTSLNELSLEMLRNIESLKVLETDEIPLGELRPGRSSCILSSLSCSLVDLSLRGCNLSNDAFPREFSNLSSLRRLNIGDNPICSLPNCIKGLTRLKKLSFSQCQSLKLLEELPKVGTLEVVGCVSLEKITYQSFWSRRHTVLWNNPNLVEREYTYKLEPIGSVDAEMINLLGLSNLESMAPIRMRKRMWMSEKDDWNPVQGLYEKGIFSTFFAGNEVPGQFSHKSTKSPISFTVPLLDNHRIQGLKVFIVYTKLYAHSSGRALPGPIITRVKNKSKGLKWIYCPRCYGIPGEGEDMIWLSLWKLEQEVHLDGSDEVVVSVIMQPWLQVKEFGIQLVQHLQEGNTNMMTVSTDSSYYPSVKSGDSSYQPGVYLLFRRSKPIQDPIWFNKILEDSDDEDTTVKEEEQHYDQTIAVTTGSNESGGLRGWKGKVLISAACFFLTLSLIARSSLPHKKKRQSTSRG